MRMVIFVALTLLVASVALAGEKQTENNVNMPELQGRGTFTGILDTDSPTWDRGFISDIPFVDDCNFILVDSSADGQYYAVICIQVTDETPIEVVVDPTLTTINDTTLYIYCDPFDAAMPFTNANYYDDDGGEGHYSAILAADNVILTPGVDYYMVLSTFSAHDMGDYVIDTSFNVVECGTVDAEDMGWGSLKANYR